MQNFFTMESSLEAECRFWNHRWISEEERGDWKTKSTALSLQSKAVSDLPYIKT